MRTWISIMALAGLAACSPEAEPPATEAPVTEASATEASAAEALTWPQPRADVVEDRFAALALSCVHQEYPNKISHVLQGDADARLHRLEGHG